VASGDLGLRQFKITCKTSPRLELTHCGVDPQILLYSLAQEAYDDKRVYTIWGIQVIISLNGE